MLWKQVHFSLLGENLAHVAQIREQALGFVAGHSVEEIGRIGEEVYDEVMADKIWPGTRALAQAHLDAGEDVWLVTATPVEVASVIASRLGLTGALGTVAESVDGVYTGRLVGEALHGPAKAVAVEALARDRGYDLARCSAYSDSVNDIPMLSLVGSPCAINPDGPLRHHARAHGWKVRDFRSGRRAAKLGVQAAGATALAGALAAAASRRRSR
jgi:HAD superfamily hydrolase (TIGR01490 family)